MKNRDFLIIYISELMDFNLTCNICYKAIITCLVIKFSKSSSKCQRRMFRTSIDAGVIKVQAFHQKEHIGKCIYKKVSWTASGQSNRDHPDGP